MSGQKSAHSRLTFRDAQKDTAWQKQLRDHYASEGAPNEIDLSLKSSIVRAISRRMAEHIILKYEWLGTMGSTNYHYGLFFENYCAGVVCFGVGTGGANINAYKEFRLNSQRELAYLARGANVHWSPVGANSRLVSIACRLLAKDTTARLVIAYSDTDAGEIGTIYQACNWICVGKGSSTNQWVAPNGRVYDQKHPSNLRASDGNRYPRAHYTAALKAKGWTEQASNPKYRYVCVLDKKDPPLMQRVQSLQTDYPKRDTLPMRLSSNSKTPIDQIGDSDATSTQTLQASPTHEIEF